MQLKHKILGKIAYLISIILKLTLRIKVIHHPEYNKHSQYLFAFWHGKQILPIIELVKHGDKRAVLASPSKDGDILDSLLTSHNYTVIRGSARSNSIRALASMVKHLKQGYSLGFGCDGPTGPIYQPKQGLAYMSQKLQIPIIPVGSAFKNKHIFNKAWDKFELPHIFSKSVFYLGQPFVVGMDEDLNQATDKIKTAIILSEEQALKQID